MINFTIGPYATPEDMLRDRHIIPYSSNKTASYVSNLFLGYGLAALIKKEKLDAQFCPLPVEIIQAKPQVTDLSMNKIITLIKKDIKNHIEVRLQLFLLQIVAVYQSKITLKKFHTQDQAGDKIKVVGNWLEPTEAHAGTLPNLIGVTEDEESASYLTDNINVSPRIFAKGTSYYHQANITHKLPRLVNEVDSDIDFRTTELEQMTSSFRDHSIKILNLSSQDNQMTPQIAFRNFLLRLHGKIRNLYYLNGIEKQTVLIYYNKVVESYLRQNASPDFIKRLMFDPRLEFPVIAQNLRQKIQFELNLIDKITEIKIACDRFLNGTQHYDDAIRTILLLSTNEGRFGHLYPKISNLTSTQEKYYKTGLELAPIINAAEMIIAHDPFLNREDPLPEHFIRLVYTQISEKENKKIKQAQLIALNILYTTAKKSQNGNARLSSFLCFSIDDAMNLMKSATIRRNVKSCLTDPAVQKLLVEFNNLIIQLMIN